MPATDFDSIDVDLKPLQFLPQQRIMCISYILRVLDKKEVKKSTVF